MLPGEPCVVSHAGQFHRVGDQFSSWSAEWATTGAGSSFTYVLPGDEYVFRFTPATAGDKLIRIVRMGVFGPLCLVEDRKVRTGTCPGRFSPLGAGSDLYCHLKAAWRRFVVKIVPGLHQDPNWLAVALESNAPVRQPSS